jgi:hypothetical protein
MRASRPENMAAAAGMLRRCAALPQRRLAGGAPSTFLPRVAADPARAASPAQAAVDDRNDLTFDQLSALLTTVFAPAAGEGALTILIDLRDARVPDHDAWRDRRRIAGEWFRLRPEGADRLPFDAVLLCGCANAGSNNNDLPADVVVARTPAELERLPDGSAEPLADVLRVTSVVLALAELSATAPPKMLAREHGFRGASMPGFSRAMIPVRAWRVCVQGGRTDHPATRRARGTAASAAGRTAAAAAGRTAAAAAGRTAAAGFG